MVRSHAFVLSTVFLAAWWVVLPLVNYNEGTSKNITVTVVAEPFLNADTLVYRWNGDIVRSCENEVRRSIVDSNSVVTRLTPKSLGKLPRSKLGRASYEISVAVPVTIAVGKAQYIAVEVPRCSWLQRVFPVEIPYPVVDFTVTR